MSTLARLELDWDHRTIFLVAGAAQEDEADAPAKNGGSH